MYTANVSAIAIPLLFVAFVKAYLNRSIWHDLFLKVSLFLSLVLLSLAIARPADFIPNLQRMGVAYIPLAGYLLWVFAFQYAVLILLGTGMLIRNLRTQSPAQRNKTLYILVGCFLGFFGGFTTFPPSLGIIKQYPYGVILVPIYSFLITYAILKHRLMDISVIIRKTLVYSSVVGVLTFIYIGVVALFAHMFEGVTGYQTVFSSSVAAALITFGFHPIRTRVQRFVDKKFFRHHVDREEKLYELSREVVTHTTAEAMAQSLMKVLSETLHPKRAALYLRARGGDGFAPVAAFGCLGLNSIADGNPLSSYLVHHPQPFVQDVPREIAASMDTRNLVLKERKREG
jgi:hypothetical protein